MDDPTPEGGALYEHLLKVPRLRRLLQSLSVGDETRWTMGLLGILRSIKIDGQRTPATDRSRARANPPEDREAHEWRKGLVRFKQNPDHKRSRIAMPTRDGIATFEGIGGTISEASQEMAEGFDIRNLDSKLRVLFNLQKSLDACRR